MSTAYRLPLFTNVRMLFHMRSDGTVARGPRRDLEHFAFHCVKAVTYVVQLVDAPQKLVGVCLVQTVVRRGPQSWNSINDEVWFQPFETVAAARVALELGCRPGPEDP